MKNVNLVQMSKEVSIRVTDIKYNIHEITYNLSRNTEHFSSLFQLFFNTESRVRLDGKAAFVINMALELMKPSSAKWNFTAVIQTFIKLQF